MVGRQYHGRLGEPYTRIIELRGHTTWKKWHKEVLVELDRLGLQHLLAADLNPMSRTEQQQYVSDQERAVRVLMNSTSPPVLRRLWACGWTVAKATLQATLSLLEALLAEPESYPQQTYGTHRDIVDLTHAYLAPGTSGMDQYLADAERCHFRLLARYGNGNSSVEELLEHLFTSSVLEGLKSARPRDYTDWMYALDHDIPFPFLDDLVSMVKPSPLGGGASEIGLAGSGARAAAPANPRRLREWDARRVRRLERRNRGAHNGRHSDEFDQRRRYQHRTHRPYRGRQYPDVYRPTYPDDFVIREVDSPNESHTLA